MERKWYKNPLVIVALLILFFPVGLFLMWKYASWNKTVKWIVTGIFALFTLSSALSPKKPEVPAAQLSVPTAQPTPTDAAITPAPTPIPVKTTNTPVPTKSKQTSTETVSQQNAVKKAKSYLSYSAFSYDGLVAQLEYEKFSSADALYGADNSGANWNDQAAKKAKSYMEYSAFSRGSLIEQLKYEKFTQAQAEYGANSVGL